MVVIRALFSASFTAAAEVPKPPDGLKLRVTLKTRLD